ncbi:MAG: UDP-2,3-diacylglucosamine diphosphatase LpxI [Nitrospinaceae bacterium]|nr:LpxI family protein [Nitrospinaceae bacterium]NIR54227.1 LpxI family protein [Nitrospinaceae bacterium]NIS84642.1 LpxI family protein [Nitrospinaceae bacterium]NIT81437.1 LpxI family protein [Nitrospinaceae bacterium]NIU43720.1 LpxI family protein [Nitrospinaceae bacterium]
MSATAPQRIGLIAGAGEIPVYLARKAQEKGLSVVSIAFTDEIDARLKPFVEKNYSISLSKSGKIFKALHDENIREVLIVGKVEKKMIFRPQLFDMETLKMILSFRTHQDKNVMLRIIDEIESRGITVLDQMDYLQELYPEKGVLTRKTPSEKVRADIEFGLPIARYMADNEIGQTIVVKNKTVIAVEGVEGTDQTIERGCALSQGGCSVIKVSRTQQDYRFDSPGIGTRTLQGMIQGEAAALALEAGRVMIIERDQVLEQADRAGISILCV